MKLLLSVLAALFVAQSAEAGAIDKSVRTLVEKLELESVAGFDLGADVAIAVSVKRGDAAMHLSNAIAGLARARLEELGVRSIIVIEVEGTLGAIETAARAQGAEWLVYIGADNIGASDRVRMFAQLRAIDRGLWVPPPKPEQTSIYATAEGELRADESVRTLLANEPVTVEPRTTKTETARFEGAPMRAAGIEDRIAAIASCKIGAREVVFAVGSRALYAFGWEGAVLRRIATLELSSLARSKEPSREPIGAAMCVKGELWFTHSDLERGQVAHLELAKGEQGLSIARALPGLPLGVLAGGKVLMGEIDHGRARFAKTVRADAMSRELAAPWIDVAIDGGLPAGFRVAAVSADYKLVRYGDELADEQAIATSGVGARLFGDEDAMLAVTTSSVATGDRDRLRLYSVERNGATKRVDTIEVNGAIYASAISAKTPEVRTLVVAAWRAAVGKTELYAIAVAGKPLPQKAASK